MNKKIVIGGVAIVVVLGVINWLGDDKAVIVQKPIKIGVMEPLTGPAASYGEVTKNGFSIALDEINKAGGIAGQPVEVVYEDSKCNGKDALTAATKLVQVDKVDYLLGAMCSSEVLAALPVTENKPMIFMGQGSSPDITGKGKYFFRTWPSDALSGVALAQKLVPQYKKIAIVSEKTDYALALGKTFSGEATKLGAEIVANETFISNETDFKPILAKIKTLNPDLLFINPQTGQGAARIAEQARNMGISAQFAVYFMAGDEFVKSGKAVNGTLILDVPSLDSKNPKAAKYAEIYKAKFGSMNYPLAGAQMYDYLYLLKTAIEKVGNDTPAIQKYLKGMDKYDGAIGSFSFDENGDVIGIGFSYKMVKDNELVDWE